jgi:uncharacterized membrane protein YhaH (DUF805 family)
LADIFFSTRSKWMSDVNQKGSDEMYCPNCGTIIKATAEICPKCGARQRPFSLSGTGGVSGKTKNGLDYFMDVMKKYDLLFSGRARRSELWWFVLFSGIVQILVGILSYLLFESEVLTSFVSMVFFAPNISVWWRRMHDAGKPGGYLFIPVYDIILAVQPSERGINKYGPDPTAD